MRAIVYTEYGSPDVLRLTDVDKPVPKENEVLVRVCATTINDWDLWLMNGEQFLIRAQYGLSKPRLRILGTEVAGRVEQAGGGVTRFKPGDDVYGDIADCGFGGFAEYVCVREDCLGHKPPGMTYAQAASLPHAAMMAYALLTKVDLQAGRRILINGASGGIGSAAVQLAKSHFGAEVTGVCGTPRMDFVKSLGASEVIDYTKEDFTRRADTYDVIFDILGRSSFSRCRRCLKPDGRYLLASFKTRRVLQMLWTGLFGRKKVVCAFASDSAADLARVREMAEAGTIRAIVDRVFQLADVAAAHRYVEEGHRKGQVAVSVAA